MKSVSFSLFTTGRVPSIVAENVVLVTRFQSMFGYGTAVITVIGRLEVTGYGLKWDSRRVYLPESTAGCELL